MKRLQGEVGRRVAELREERNLTQEDLAEQLGLYRSQIQEIEQGRSNLTLRSLAKLADHFGIPVADLFVPPKTARAKRGRPRKRKDTSQ